MRTELIARAGGLRCEDCGTWHPDVRATHIIGLADGGDYMPENGRLRCPTCDRKTDRHAR